MTFTGYFFKRIATKPATAGATPRCSSAAASNPVAEVVEPVPSLFGSIYLPVLFGILGAALLLALGLAWRLRLGDRKVRERLQVLRSDRVPSCDPSRTRIPSWSEACALHAHPKRWAWHEPLNRLR